MYVDYGSNVRLGTWVFLNYGCQLADVATITIGDHCQIGPTSSSSLRPTRWTPSVARTSGRPPQPITLGRNVWVGGGAIICPGVTIGDDTVVGAGSGRDQGPAGQGACRRQPGQGDPRLD